MSHAAKCVLALDQGTTSSRAVLFDRQCRVVAIAQREFRQIFPQPGWVEHDPREIWESQSATAVEALERAGLSAADVAAIGITNQRETTVVWNRTTGQPIHNAIVWQDRRTAEQCERLRGEGHALKVAGLTGLVIDPYFSGTKAAWILDQFPDAREAASGGSLACGTVDSWLIDRLTGGRMHVTDPSNASRTMLYNIHTGQWDDTLGQLLRVPRKVLPHVVPSSGVVAQVTDPPQLRGIPIAGIAGDQQAALFGQLCNAPGLAKNTYGTGCFALLNTGKQPVASKHRMLTTVAWQTEGRITYALEGSVFDAGSVIQWLRDNLRIIGTAPQINALASSVPDSGGVTLIPAFSGLGAPHWDARARGAILGITRATTAAHLARAALEGIAHQVADVFDAMAADAGAPVREIRVDGGLSASDPLMQLQSDILQVPLVRPKSVESTALGAAMLAGLAVGFWTSCDEMAEHRQIDRRFEPQVPPARAAQWREQWRQAIGRITGDV